MSTSVYPNMIDGYSQIPLVIDNVTPVNAITVNSLRSAIIAIEEELGLLPSSTDYDTVRARLDALTDEIGELEQEINSISTTVSSGALFNLVNVSVSSYQIANDENYIFMEQNFDTDVQLPNGDDHLTKVIAVKTGNLSETHNYTITAAAGETIDDNPSIQLPINYSSVSLVFNSANKNWGII